MQCGDLAAAMKQFSSVEAIADGDPSKGALAHCNRWAAAELACCDSTSRTHCLVAAAEDS